MSTTSSVSGSSSAAVDYATQLATTSTLSRSLANLGTAIQNGDLSSANSIMTGIINANPQFAYSSSSSSSPSSSSSSSSPINNDFETIANAISNNDTTGAQVGWAQLKTDLSNQGINITNPATSTQQLIAQTDASIDQSFLSTFFGASSGSGSAPSIAELLGGTSTASTSSDPVQTALNTWMTYNATGNTSSAASSTTGNALNTAA